MAPERGKPPEVEQPMAFDRRGYYYRSKRVGGGVRREYLGRGLAAELAAGIAQLERARWERDRETLRAERAGAAAFGKDTQPPCPHVYTTAKSTWAAVI